MRVRFLDRWWQAVTPATGHEYVEGMVVDLPDADARAAIEAGAAVLADDETPAEDEDGA